MPLLHRRGSWEQTRRELLQIAWAVVLIDAIAVGLGALAARHVGAFAWGLGVGLAVFVTVSFALLVGGNLVVESLMHRWRTRRERSRVPGRSRR